MTEENKKVIDPAEGVPAKIFNEFLNQLGKNDIPEDVVNVLRKTILKEQNQSETAIRNALFPAEQSK